MLFSVDSNGVVVLCFLDKCIKKNSTLFLN